MYTLGGFFFSSRRRHTRSKRDWSSDVCSSDLRSSGAPNMAAAADCACLWVGAAERSVEDARKGVAGGAKIGTGWRLVTFGERSEERRVGKECRCGGSTDH